VRQRHIFWIGLLLYAVSFLLVAVVHSFTGFTIPGYSCASSALLSPWEPDEDSDGRFAFLCLLISGWINPVFLITAIFVFFGGWKRLIAVMRIIVALMIPFYWISFHYEGVYPREGHFVWIAGMLVTLFSRELAGRTNRELPA
jgi:hypothetical protein